MKTIELGTSRTLSRRTLLVATSSLAVTGCFASFAATRALWKFNDDFGNKWVKWLVFLGLSILPVYSLFVLADVLVLNSLEFWTGSNPLARTADGRRVARHETDDPRTVRIEVSRDGEVEQVAYFRRVDAEHLQLLDADGRVQADVRSGPDGAVQLRDAQGRLLVELSTAQLQRAEAQISSGETALVALHAGAGLRTEQLARGIAGSGQL